MHTLEASAPNELDRSTVALAFSSEPRRLQGQKGQYVLRHEEDLLSDRSHDLLLGNPGSGKTTTMKRIAKRLLSEPTTGGDEFQFPVVIRLRELASGMSVHMTLGSILGLQYETVEIKGRVGGISITNYETRVDGERIETVLARVLSDLGAVILLDGLDEVWSDARGEIALEISRLARGLSGSKLIVSSRTGDYTSNLENFATVQLCPLTAEQIRQIAGRWLDYPRSFIAALEKLPYRDVADRPLLLSQLLLLYRRHGFLPEQPAKCISG